MGSYDHGFQENRIIKKTVNEVTKVNIQQKIRDLKGINVENASRPMKYLQRVVKSILRQMNVQSHVFGPGEAITIDLRAEIKYDDFVSLTKFINAEDFEEPDKYLNKVDEVMSNLIHVVEHSTSHMDYLQYLVNLPIFNSLKFWLVAITMTVVCFLIVMLSLRTVYAKNNWVMLLYGFLIIFILSCIWTFSYMYEEEKATNHARLTQMQQNPPKDCDYENLSILQSISYFFRVYVGGHKDQCVQYYSNTMTDPFWRVNPLEAISQSFSVLVFAPFGYIGEKIGLFFGGIINGIPFWLQPLLIILMFGFIFLSLFGYRIVSPLLTIEPAYRDRDQSRIQGQGGPAITDSVRNELVERPERKIMKSRRNASTDMDGFDIYISGQNDQHQRDTERWDWTSHWFIEILLQIWEMIITILDKALRQCPDGDVVAEDHEFVLANLDDEHHPPEVVEEEDDDVLIPRRRIIRNRDNIMNDNGGRVNDNIDQFDDAKDHQNLNDIDVDAILDEILEDNESYDKE